MSTDTDYLMERLGGEEKYKSVMRDAFLHDQRHLSLSEAVFGVDDKLGGWLQWLFEMTGHANLTIGTFRSDDEDPALTKASLEAKLQAYVCAMGLSFPFDVPVVRGRLRKYDGVMLSSKENAGGRLIDLAYEDINPSTPVIDRDQLMVEDSSEVITGGLTVMTARDGHQVTLDVESTGWPEDMAFGWEIKASILVEKQVPIAEPDTISEN